jgi:hypothetical protein
MIFLRNLFFQIYRKKEIINKLKRKAEVKKKWHKGLILNKIISNKTSMVSIPLYYRYTKSFDFINIVKT